MSDGVFRSDDPMGRVGARQAGNGDSPSETTAQADDWRLIELLRGGDEAAFIVLIDSYHKAMLRLATIFVTRPMVAEEVVQETWMAVLEGLPRFEGRSSLKTWIFRILTNRAKTRAVREGRSLPFASFADAQIENDEPAVGPDRFRPPGAQWAGGWVSFPATWEAQPEERALTMDRCLLIQSRSSCKPSVSGNKNISTRVRSILSKTQEGTKRCAVSWDGSTGKKTSLARRHWSSV